MVLRRRGFLAIDFRLKHRLPRIVLASVAMAAVLAALHWGLAGWLTAGVVQRIAALAALVVAGLASFAAFSQLTGAAGLADLRGLMRSKEVSGG